MTTTTQSQTAHSNAAFAAAAIIDEAGDLAGFLAAAGDDLPGDIAVEVSVLLDGVRQVLQGITAKVANAGPG